MLFNLENFFLESEEGVSPFKKPVEKIVAIKNIIEDISPEICMFTEIGGESSLNNFNQQYLNNLYNIQMLPGNSDRGIEIGYLTKKDLAFKTKLISHRDHKLFYEFQGKKFETKFSRDVLELQLLKNDKVEFIIFLVHLKSKWDREGNDPGGQLKRRAELDGLVQIYQNRKSELESIPMIIAGDFNGLAGRNNFEPEFRSIYTETDLEDVLELLAVKEEERETYYQFTREGKRSGFQLDYIFLNSKLTPLLQKENSGVYRYNLGINTPFTPPQSVFERTSLPSDHYPLVINLNF